MNHRTPKEKKESGDESPHSKWYNTLNGWQNRQ
jgi:hypothetical protein